jgi:hypothetical protein
VTDWIHSATDWIQFTADWFAFRTVKNRFSEGLCTFFISEWLIHHPVNSSPAKKSGDVLSDIPVQSIIFLSDYGVTRRKKLVVFVSGEFV